MFCMLQCYKPLSNEGMKPARLKRHFMTQHPELPKERIFEAGKSFYKIFGVIPRINESILFSGAKSDLSQER